MKIIITLVTFFLSAVSFADMPVEKVNAAKFFLKNVTTFTQVKNIIKTSSLSEDNKAYLLSNLPDSGRLPKIAVSSKEVSFVEDGKKVTLQIPDQDKGVMSVNGILVKLDFENNFKGTFENIKSAANGKKTAFNFLIPEARANGYVILEIAAGIAAYALCEKRACGHEILAFLVGPAYLLWVAADMYLISPAHAEEIEIQKIGCPANNNGKLEYSFKLGTENKTVAIDYDQNKNPTRMREVKDGRTISTQFLTSDWKVSSGSGASQGVDYSKLAQSLKAVSQECSKEPQKMEAMNSVGVTLRKKAPSDSGGVK
ncbi:MAG: hypothetical protein ABL927_00235 [Bdellovibrionales bacterium]